MNQRFTHVAVTVSADLFEATPRSELLAVYSMGSTAWDLFQMDAEREVTRLAKQHERVQLELVRDVDHIFTLLWSQEQLTSSVLDWARLRLSGAQE